MKTATLVTYSNYRKHRQESLIYLPSGRPEVPAKSALREWLEIVRWAVLCLSFGAAGLLAVWTQR